jgi:hypothetical protein
MLAGRKEDVGGQAVNRRRKLGASRPLSMALALVAPACAMIGHEPPPSDWPSLKRVVIETENAPQMIDACVRRGLKVIGYGIFTTVGACAHADFCTMTCTKVWPKGASETTKMHEEKHCEGRDHPGETTFKNAWAAYKRDPEAYCTGTGT